MPSSAFADPAETVAGLNAARVCVANLVINDFSKARGPTPFNTFAPDRIVAMANACRDAGIRVWLTSWAMPHDVFMLDALEQLPGLLERAGAELLVWDAEEPWTDALGVTAFDYEHAAGLASMLSVPLGITGIGSAPPSLRPLSKVCRVFMPQAYATDDSQATPGGVVEYSVREWRERYGEPGRWCIGLAAYDQPVPAWSSMAPPIIDVQASGITSVCYWTSRAMERRDVCEFVAGVSAPKELAHPGIMPTLDLASMPVGVRSQAVAEVQALLSTWDVDPGKIDGKPGPKTRAAVQAFQRAKGLAVTGVVDGATWCELLRP